MYLCVQLSCDLKGFQVLGDHNWGILELCFHPKWGGGVGWGCIIQEELIIQVRRGRGLRAGGSTLVLWLRLPSSPRFLFLPFPSPVSRQTNSSLTTVSGNLWKSLNVQDGIHAGEVSFLSSIFFSFFFLVQQLLVVVLLLCPVYVVVFLCSRLVVF